MAKGYVLPNYRRFSRPTGNRLNINHNLYRNIPFYQPLYLYRRGNILGFIIYQKVVYLKCNYLVLVEIQSFFNADMLEL